MSNLLHPDLCERLIHAQRDIEQGDAARTPILARLNGPSATYLLAALDVEENTLWAVVDFGQGNVAYGTVELSELDEDLAFDEQFDPAGLFVDNVLALEDLSAGALDTARMPHRGLRF